MVAVHTDNNPLCQEQTYGEFHSDNATSSSTALPTEGPPLGVSTGDSIDSGSARINSSTVLIKQQPTIANQLQLSNAQVVYTFTKPNISKSLAF